MYQYAIKLFVGLVLLQLPIIVSAQFGSNRVVFIGLKADVQSSGIANQNNYGQNEMDYGINPGVGIGGVVTYQVSQENTLLAELSYQTGGQDYDDRFKGRHFMKDVRYDLLSVPIAFRHKLSKAVGYSGVGAESKPIWYVMGGIQVNKIISPKIDWYLDGAETDFLGFVLEGSNPNQAQIESMGAPASDEELFTQWDCMFIGAGGFQLFLNSTVHMTIELRGGIGITDINAKPWRLKNNDDIYGASRNSFLGLHVGMHMQLKP